MNKLNLLDVAYCWPYCALAARYDEDSGDGDKNLNDFIEDVVCGDEKTGRKGWLPGAIVTRLWEPERLDFTYAIEHEGKLLIAFLGTEGKITERGWISDLSPQYETKNFKREGGHVDFIQAGERAGKYFIDLVEKYIDGFYAVGHSRGGPRLMSAVKYWHDQLGAFPIRAIPFCSPPVWNHDAATAYDACGLGALTIRPTMSHDPIDLLGLPVLKHVGVELKLPDIITTAMKKRPVIGPMFYGHAYSSVFECLIKYCEDHFMKPEVKWLNDTKWVAEV